MTTCVFEKEALVKVWIEYMGELFADDRVTRPESGPSITSTEVKHAIKKLKNNKATGTELIAAEMMKALDDGPIGKLTQLCNEIYNTGYWPTYLKESIFIPHHHHSFIRQPLCPVVGRRPQHVVSK